MSLQEPRKVDASSQVSDSEIEAQKAGERGPRAAMERHITRVAPQEIFLGGYFSGVFGVLIWALEPGSQRASDSLSLLL